MPSPFEVQRLLGCGLRRLECPDSTLHSNDRMIILDRAFKSFVWDVTGKVYLDLCAGFGSLIFGHNDPGFAPPPLVNGTPEIEQGMSDLFASRSKIELLETLNNCLPEQLTRISLLVTGSQAVEFALKTAMIATRRSGFISFRGGYHGVELSVLTITHDQKFRAPFGGYLRQEQISFLDYGCPIEGVEQAIAQQRQAGHPTAAIIVEPVQARGGCRMPADGWLMELANLAKLKDVVLILDEVFTGLGRLGGMTRATTVPCDLLCLGKALGNGFPISACIGTEKVMASWPRNVSEAIHSGTFNGHPWLCRRATLVLREYHRREIESHVSKIEPVVLNWLASAWARWPHVIGIRGKGMMFGIEFDSAKIALAKVGEAQEQGLLVYPAGTVGEVMMITPALDIEMSTLVRGLEQLATILTTSPQVQV